MKTTLDLPEELMRRAQAGVARMGVTVEETLRQALEAGLPERGEKTIEWDHFSGTLAHGPDPLEFQHAIRDEWNECGH